MDKIQAINRVADIPQPYNRHVTHGSGYVLYYKQAVPASAIETASLVAVRPCADTLGLLAWQHRDHGNAHRCQV